MVKRQQAKSEPTKKFSSALEESDWWDQFSLEELIAMSEPTDIQFVDAQPKKTISLRLNEELLIAAKQAAKELRIGYQTLFRIWIREGLQRQDDLLRSKKARKKKGAA